MGIEDVLFLLRFMLFKNILFFLKVIFGVDVCFIDSVFFFVFMLIFWLIEMFVMIILILEKRSDVVLFFLIVNVDLGVVDFNVIVCGLFLLDDEILWELDRVNDRLDLIVIVMLLEVFSEVFFKVFCKVLFLLEEDK